MTIIGPTTTITGNITDEIDYKVLPSGAEVANFTVAVTPRYQDKQSGDWKDAVTMFFRCVAWRRMATNIADSMGKGSRVTFLVEMVGEEWETDEKQQRRAIKYQVVAGGPDMTFSGAKANRMARKSEGGVPEADPWASDPSTAGATSR
jgi:single-strand DNA-binding protein